MTRRPLPGQLIAMTCAIACALALLAIPATAQPGRPDNPGRPAVPGPPMADPEDPVAEPAAMDYTAIQGLSQPDRSTVTEVVTLQMRDGVEIYLEVTRPDEDGQFPVIYEASPYHGTIADRQGTRIFPDPTDQDGNRIGLTGYFAPRGYAVVMMNLRGTGRSSGCLDHMGQADALDMVEVIEWINEQDWYGGRIGMTGHSYVGSTPMIVAAKQPPGLVTIVPSAGIARAYDHQFQDGVAYAGQYLGLPAAYNLLAAEANLFPDGDNFGNSPLSGVCGLTTSSVLGEGPNQVTGEMGAFHAARDHTEGATAFDGSVFMVQGSYDRAVRPPAIRWFTARQDDRDKLWYGQWDHGSGVHPNRRFDQWVGALHAWFDRELQLRDVETGPAVELFVNGQRTRADAITAHESVVQADSWPISGTDTLTLYPAAGGTLGGDRPAVGTVTARGSRIAALRQDAVFATEPFAETTMLAGPPRLSFVGSFTSQNLDLIVNLYEEAPDGSRREVSQFALNPALRNSIENAEPVIPGVRYDLDMPGWPLAHQVPEGHRLVMRVTTVDSDKMGINTEDPMITVMTGRLGTVLRLPVLPDAELLPDPLQPAPEASDPAGQSIR